jgi:molybdopterin synthase sulfur carrier subunit
MKVRLLFFSVLQDITALAEEQTSLPSHVTSVGQLLEHLFQRWPALRSWDASLLIALDQVYARRDEALTPGCEVALMPPVQGG